MNRQVLLVSPLSDYLTVPDALAPLGLLYLGAALEARGFDPRVVDLNLPGIGIAGYDPILIGVTCVTANYVTVEQLIRLLKLEYPGVSVIVGGPHVSSMPDDGRRLGAQATCLGDGEMSICSAAEDVVCKSQVQQVYRKSVDVDMWPLPARHLVPLQDYRCCFEGRRATNVITQRGCPYSCSFCCHYNGYHKVRARAIDNVIEEIRQLKTAGFSAVNFRDDEFNLSNNRLLRLCKELEPEHIRFKVNVRADLLTDEQAEALSRAGCGLICVGVESGSRRILDLTRKGTTPEINSRARHICRKYGIRFKAFVMVGLPGETSETVKETTRWLIDNQVDDLTVTLFIPYPGTPVWNNPKDFDISFDLDYEHKLLPFRGRPGLPLPCVTSTSGLSAAELAALPEAVEQDVRRELGLPLV